VSLFAHSIPKTLSPYIQVDQKETHLKLKFR